MSQRTLTILGVLAVLVLLAVIFDRRPTTPDQRREERHLLPAFSVDAVTGIALVRGQDPAITLERTAAGWRLAGLKIDAAAVDALLGSVAFASVQRWVTSPPGPTRVELRLTAARGQTHRLRLGGDDASGQLVYVTVDDRPEVAVVEKRLLSLADQPATAWIARTLTVADPSRMNRLTVGAMTVDREQILRDGGSDWAEPAHLAAAWRALDEAHAVAVLPIVPDGFPVGGTRLVLDGHLEATLGGACGANRTEVWRSDGARLCFADPDLAPLRPPAIADPRLFPVALDDIQAVKAGRFTLRHDNGRWLYGDLQLDDHKVRAWLSSLLALRAPHVDTAYIVTLEARTRTVEAGVAAIPDPQTLR